MKNQGFTLLDLLITVTIMTIIAGFGIPSMSALVEKTRADSAANVIVRSFQFARATAIMDQQIITFCGSDDGQHCSRTWGKYLLVFADANDDKICDPGELILQELLDLENSPMTTRLGFGRSYTRLNLDGSVELQGSVLYCRPGRPGTARRITWNMVGRPYIGRDRDGDGFVEDTDGKPISCSKLR